MKAITTGNQYSLSQIGNKLRIFNDRVIDITNLSLTVTPSAGLTLVSIEAIGDESFVVDTWTKPSLTTMTDLLRDVTIEVTDDSLEEYSLNIDFTYDEDGTDTDTDDNSFNLKLDVLGCGNISGCYQSSLAGLDNVEIFADFASFPATGQNDTLYVDSGQHDVYYWDGSTYILLSTSSAVWGSISGTIGDQADLVALISSSVFSGDYGDLSNKPTLTQSGGDVTGSIDLDAGTFALTAPSAPSSTVSTDSTINGDGSVGDPLGVANEFTALEKSKLAGIEDNAQVNVQSDWNQATNTEDDYIQNKPTNLSDFNDDIGASDNDSSIFSQNITTGDISHQSDSGAAATTAVIKSNDANNLIKTGSDGGNLLLGSDLPAYTHTAYQSGNNPPARGDIEDESLSVGSSVTIVEAGTYLINWRFYAAFAVDTTEIIYKAALTTIQHADLSGGAGAGSVLDTLDVVKEGVANTTDWQHYSLTRILTIPSPATDLYITLYSPGLNQNIAIDEPSFKITAVKL